MTTPGRLALLLPLFGLVALASTDPKVGAKTGPFEPLGILKTVQPSYPDRLADRFLDRGEARIMIMVDEEGRLADWIVTGYTHALFAKEALDVLPKWKFEPARFHGRPIGVRTELRFIFRNSGGVRIVPGDLEMRLRVKDIRQHETFWQRVCHVEELDQPLDAIVEISPMQPDRLGAVAREGKVVVEYFIDPEGRVRMPLVLSSDDEAFTKAVLMAITEWRYATPTRDGQPVLARVAREFKFQAVN